MSWDTVMHGRDVVLQRDAGRSEHVVRTAELIRQAGGYCWVGLYEACPHAGEGSHPHRAGATPVSLVAWSRRTG